MQVLTLTAILEPDSRLELKSLMDKEINEALDTTVSKYQSQSPQQVKHPDCSSLQLLCKKIEEVASEVTNKSMFIKNCWFVICKEDSKFEFHNHAPEKMSAVYYLENCNNNGTIFETLYTKLQVLSEDNTAIIFDSETMHSTPKWNGTDRYSISFDLDFQN